MTRPQIPTITTWTTLVQAEALAEVLSNANGASEGRRFADGVVPLVMFDCRFSLADASAGEAAWRASRLPGARYAHLERDLSDMHAPHVSGSGRHPWPKANDVAAWLRECGVTPATQVVAYDAGDGAHAARLWCVLHMLGYRRAAVLDGGWERWNALGLPIETGTDARIAMTGATNAKPSSRTDCVDRGDERPQFDRKRLLDAVAVQAHLAGGGLLIDARASERFRGEMEPIDRVAGHVPGAVNRPFGQNLRDGRFKSAAELATEFQSLLGEHDANDAVAMCGSGVTACHHVLAMAHAGLGECKLFTGSWSGWIEDTTRPVATGES